MLFGTALSLLCVLGRASQPHPADWMAQGSFGMMVHYLVTPDGDDPTARSADLNRTVDGFDLDGFMNQFSETGADWLIFTIGQNTGCYNSPNEVLDVLLPGHTSKRDLVAEIAGRVKGMGKHFISYLPVEMTQQSDDMKQAFGWNPEDQTHFLKRYLSFIRAYSVKLGPLNDGWWYDGWAGNLTQGWDPRDWIEASKAGNPKSIVAISDAGFLLGREQPVSPLQGYLAGEVHFLYQGKIHYGFVSRSEDLTEAPDGTLLLRGEKLKLYMPSSRFVDGVQWHALVPLELTFNPAISNERCHYSDEELTEFVRGCKKVEGAVTLNVPIDRQGHIPAPSAAQLKRLSEALR